MKRPTLSPVKSIAGDDSTACPNFDIANVFARNVAVSRLPVVFNPSGQDVAL
jgi:hypothetical protein